MTSIDPENTSLFDAGAAFAKKLTLSDRAPEDVFRRVAGHLGPFFRASAILFAKVSEEPCRFEPLHQWNDAEAGDPGPQIVLDSFLDATHFGLLSFGSPVCVEDTKLRETPNESSDGDSAVRSYIVVPYLVSG